MTGKRFDGKTPEVNAVALVGKKTLTTRKTEQSVNLPLITSSLLMIVVIPVGYVWLLGRTIDRQNQAVNARTTEIANGSYQMFSQMSGTLTAAAPLPPVNPNAGDVSRYLTPQVVIMATTETTPTPHATATPYHVIMNFRYSYYNPKLGGVNCLYWDVNLSDCTSLLADGERWQDNFGKVLACPPDIALGTVFDILAPPELAHIWTCKDRGGAIVGDMLDFLDVAQRVQWLSVVTANVYPPETPEAQINNGSH